MGMKAEAAETAEGRSIKYFDEDRQPELSDS
jgi:hypothetical protein